MIKTPNPDRPLQVLQSNPGNALVQRPEMFRLRLAKLIKDGRNDTLPDRQRDRCHGCRKRFDDPSWPAYFSRCGLAHLALTSWA